MSVMSNTQVCSDYERDLDVGRCWCQLAGAVFTCAIPLPKIRSSVGSRQVTTACTSTIKVTVDIPVTCQLIRHIIAVYGTITAHAVVETFSRTFKLTPSVALRNSRAVASLNHQIVHGHKIHVLEQRHHCYTQHYQVSLRLIVSGYPPPDLNARVCRSLP